MGNTFRRLFDGLVGNREMRVVMLGTSGTETERAMLCT